MGDLNPNSPHNGKKAIPLSYKAFGKIISNIYYPKKKNDTESQK